MRIEDLSIGACVCCKGAVALVREIEQEWVTVNTAGGLVCVAPDCLEPIGLTPDLLKGLGFSVDRSERCGFPSWVAADGGFFFNLICGLANGIGRSWTLHIDNADRQTVASCDIAYLHEAGQLAWLAGYRGDLFTLRVL